MKYVSVLLCSTLMAACGSDSGTSQHDIPSDSSGGSGATVSSGGNPPIAPGDAGGAGFTGGDESPAQAGGRGGASGEDSTSDFGLGDNGPAGGFIFYDKGASSDGWRYLEAAPDNWSGSVDPDKFGLGCSDRTHGTDSAVGAGSSNTAAFLESGCSSGVLKQVEALAIEVDGVTYDDWFLPSEDELVLMYEALAAEGRGLFRQQYYFSSTEVDKDTVATVHLGYGIQDSVFKEIARPFRPVRTF